MELLVALVVLALGFVAWAVYDRLRQRRRLDWAQLADNVGFAFFPGNEMHWPLIQGTYHDRDVRLTAEPGDPKLEASETTRVVEFFDANLPSGLFIARHGMLGALENIFQMEQLEIGEPELDALLLIKGSDADEVYKLFSDTGVRHALESFVETYPSAQITSSSVSVVLPHLISGVGEVRKVIEDIQRVIDVLEEAVEISAAEEGAEGRRSSVSTKAPELRYAPTPLSSLYDEDMDLKGPATEEAKGPATEEAKDKADQDE